MEVAAPLLFWLLLLSCSHCIISQPGFISINCGGKEEYRDDHGIVWAPDNNITFGEIAQTAGSKEYPKQHTTLRHFPADNTQKFCYKFDVKNRIRYLVRAAFLYGNFDGSNVYPKFDLYLGSTYWSTIAVFDTDTVVVRESIILTTSPTISVCLFKATTGKAFISTLELREFNGSLYTTDFENQFFLSVSARINFGAESSDPIRYPYDPYDRIWESDSLQKANYLVDKAEGTKKISTTMPIDVSLSERPPEKVMQTAVVGTEGSLTYRLNLNGFPGFGWAVSYFSEIEDLDLDETRKFRFIIPGSNSAQYSKVVVNVQENAQGKYRLYEPGYQNISFPFVFPFEFRKTNDSSRGPILNALEISKYVEISSGSQDAATMASFISRYVLEDWAQEGGDPCLPAPWSWVQCNSEPQPRIVSVKLSRKNLTENIPMELSNLTGLVELWLDQNSLVGSIPDLSNCVELKKIHLENNWLTGPLPLELIELPNLSELYLQNNMLSGNVPEEFSNKKIIFNFSGNSLSHQKQNSQKNQIIIIVSSMIVVLIILIAAFSFYQCYKRRINLSSKEDGLLSNPPSQKLASFFNEVKAETSYKFTLSELEDATNKFVKQVGSGGYGVVYYGKLKDGKEIAVKVLTSDSFQGNREFSNEVSLLSRIHHRNLVAFLGYCQQNGKNILVYDFMHNGTLKEHLYGLSAQQRALSWLERLEIAEDAARGIEYLHTGCTPTIIHRDVKSSNILLEKNMRAKVSDFGLSKLAVDGSSHVSSVVRGTVGYLDPEYYISQQLTEKSDVYSFGVILLELISGQEAISNERFGVNCRNIVQWAKAHIESGYIEAVIDPALQNDFHIQSVWKIAEKAISCVQPYGSHRPTISDVLKEIQEAILIEKVNEAEDEAGEDINTDMITSSMRTTVNIEDSVDTATPGRDMSLSDTVMLPVAR